jgi:hypothetical protein
MLVYQRFFPTLDLIIGFLGLIIKAFDNQTEIFRELGLIIKRRDGQPSQHLRENVS